MFSKAMKKMADGTQVPNTIWLTEEFSSRNYERIKFYTESNCRRALL